MENESAIPTSTQTPPLAPTANDGWTATKVYSLGAICLVLGIIIGALFHSPATQAATHSIASEQSVPTGPAQTPPGATSPDSVLERLRSDPNNFDLLLQAGNAAMQARDPKSAVDYYGRALKVKDDIGVRTNLGNAYFRFGDADDALREFATVLKSDPKNENALYNTGMVRLLAKNDPKGAIASWETFLKFHPDYPRKALVLEQIDRAKKAAKAAPNS